LIIENICVVAGYWISSASSYKSTENDTPLRPEMIFAGVQKCTKIESDNFIAVNNAGGNRSFLFWLLLLLSEQKKKVTY
jgi:hypothetical protein